MLAEGEIFDSVINVNVDIGTDIDPMMSMLAEGEIFDSVMSVLAEGEIFDSVMSMLA